jgi:hypothetical protein
MRKLLLVFVVAFGINNLHAQNNANEAKAAYLLAEECYGKGDYKCALDFLQQVKTALGTANCKVLYLQIMATRELDAKDPNISGKVLTLIDEFEKSADYKDFNEEKSLEITKLKLVMRSEQKVYKAKTDSANRIKAEQEKYFFETVNKWGPYGLNIDELDKAKPDWKVKEWEIFESKKNGEQVIHPAEFIYTQSAYPFAKMKDGASSLNKLAGIVLTDGKVRGYLYYEIDIVGKDAMQSSGLLESLLLFTEKTGITPIGGKFRSDEQIFNSYTWVSGDYIVVNYNYELFNTRGKGAARLLRHIEYHPSPSNTK